MLDVTPTNMMAEIRSAERLRDGHIAGMADQVERFHGPYYSEVSDTGAYNGENHYYEYVSLIVPRLIYDNPRVRVRTRRPGTQGMVAEATRHGLNRWVREVRLRKTLTELATDMVFNFGVLLVTEENNRGLNPIDHPQMPGTPMWPKVSRISQQRFIVDPVATCMEDARFAGHKWVRDKADLLKMAKDDPDAGWNAEAIEKMATTSDGRELGRKSNNDLPDRDEVVAYEIWVPEVDLDESLGADEGFHGTIYTISVNTSGDDEKTAFIRKPRPYYGPRWGPYVFFGLYKVPDSFYPLSPLVAVEGQIRDLNNHVESASNSAAKYKKLILVDNTDPKFVQRVKDARSDFVIPVSGLEKQRVVQAEIGGMTQQQLAYIQTARDRLDRNSGITDAQRGNVEGRGTATEVAVAAEAHTVRLAYIKQQFADSVVQVLKTIAWFFYYDDRVVIPLGQEGQEALGVEEPWLVGGDHDPESGATFDDLELEIEPHSMERTTESTHSKRIMEMYQLLMQTAPMMPQMPWVNWSALYKRLGDALNVEGLDEMVDMGVVAQMGGQGGPEAPGEVRYANDVGVAGKARPKITQAQNDVKPPGLNGTPDLMPGQLSGIEQSNAMNFGGR